MIPQHVVHIARSLYTGVEVARGHTVDDVCRVLEAMGVSKDAVFVDLLRE